MAEGMNDIAVLQMTTPRLNPLEPPDDIADTADVVTILNALFADNVSAVFVKKAFANLLKHVKTRDGAKEVHQHLGELTILAILRMKLGVPVIQSYGFVLIRKLSCACVESNRLFVDNGAIEIISTGLRRYPEDMILQSSASGALVPLVQNYEQTIAIVIAHGLVPVLLRPILLRTEKTPDQTIVYTCSIVNTICEAQGKDIIDSLLSGQVTGSDPSWPVLKELLHILQATIENDDKRKLAGAVCGTLLCLMSMDRMVTDVLEELHGLSVVSHAMVQYASDNGVQKYSGIVCQQLARSPVKSIRMKSPHKAEAIYKARQFIATSPKKPAVKEGIVYDFMPKLNDPDKERVLAQTQVAERASRGNLLTSAYGFSKPQRKMDPSPPKEVKARPPARLPPRVLTTKSPVKPSPQSVAIRQGKPTALRIPNSGTSPPKVVQPPTTSPRVAQTAPVARTSPRITAMTSPSKNDTGTISVTRPAVSNVRQASPRRPMQQKVENTTSLEKPTGVDCPDTTPSLSVEQFHSFVFNYVQNVVNNTLHQVTTLIVPPTQSILSINPTHEEDSKEAAAEQAVTDTQPETSMQKCIDPTPSDAFEDHSPEWDAEVMWLAGKLAQSWVHKGFENALEHLLSLSTISPTAPQQEELKQDSFQKIATPPKLLDEAASIQIQPQTLAEDITELPVELQDSLPDTKALKSNDNLSPSAVKESTTPEQKDVKNLEIVALALTCRLVKSWVDEALVLVVQSMVQSHAENTKVSISILAGQLVQAWIYTTMEEVVWFSCRQTRDEELKDGNVGIPIALSEPDRPKAIETELCANTQTLSSECLDEADKAMLVSHFAGLLVRSWIFETLDHITQFSIRCHHVDTKEIIQLQSAEIDSTENIESSNTCNDALAEDHDDKDQELHFAISSFTGLLVRAWLFTALELVIERTIPVKVSTPICQQTEDMMQDSFDKNGGVESPALQTPTTMELTPGTIEFAPERHSVYNSVATLYEFSSWVGMKTSVPSSSCYTKDTSNDSPKELVIDSIIQSCAASNPSTPYEEVQEEDENHVIASILAGHCVRLWVYSGIQNYVDRLHPSSIPEAQDPSAIEIKLEKNAAASEVLDIKAIAGQLVQVWIREAMEAQFRSFNASSTAPVVEANSTSTSANEEALAVTTDGSIDVKPKIALPSSYALQIALDLAQERCQSWFGEAIERCIAMEMSKSFTLPSQVEYQEDVNVVYITRLAQELCFIWMQQAIARVQPMPLTTPSISITNLLIKNETLQVSDQLTETWLAEAVNSTALCELPSKHDNHTTQNPELYIEECANQTTTLTLSQNKPLASSSEVIVHSNMVKAVACSVVDAWLNEALENTLMALICPQDQVNYQQENLAAISIVAGQLVKAWVHEAILTTAETLCKNFLPPVAYQPKDAPVMPSSLKEVNQGEITTPSLETHPTTPSSFLSISIAQLTTQALLTSWLDDSVEELSELAASSLAMQRHNIALVIASQSVQGWLSHAIGEIVSFSSRVHQHDLATTLHEVDIDPAIARLSGYLVRAYIATALDNLLLLTAPVESALNGAFAIENRESNDLSEEMAYESSSECDWDMTVAFITSGLVRAWISFAVENVMTYRLKASTHSSSIESYGSHPAVADQIEVKSLIDVSNVEVVEDSNSIENSSPVSEMADDSSSECDWDMTIALISNGLVRSWIYFVIQNVSANYFNATEMPSLNNVADVQRLNSSAIYPSVAQHFGFTSWCRLTYAVAATQANMEKAGKSLESCSLYPSVAQHFGFTSWSRMADTCDAARIDIPDLLVDSVEVASQASSEHDWDMTVALVSSGLVRSWLYFAISNIVNLRLNQTMSEEKNGMTSNANTLELQTPDAIDSSGAQSLDDTMDHKESFEESPYREESDDDVFSENEWNMTIAFISSGLVRSWIYFAIEAITNSRVQADKGVSQEAFQEAASTAQSTQESNRDEPIVNYNGDALNISVDAAIDTENDDSNQHHPNEMIAISFYAKQLVFTWIYEAVESISHVARDITPVNTIVVELPAISMLARQLSEVGVQSAMAIANEILSSRQAYQTIETLNKPTASLESLEVSSPISQPNVEITQCLDDHSDMEELSDPKEVFYAIFARHLVLSWTYEAISHVLPSEPSDYPVQGTLAEKDYPDCIMDDDEVCDSHSDSIAHSFVARHLSLAWIYEGISRVLASIVTPDTQTSTSNEESLHLQTQEPQEIQTALAQEDCSEYHDIEISILSRHYVLAWIHEAFHKVFEQKLAIDTATIGNDQVNTGTEPQESVRGIDNSPLAMPAASEFVLDEAIVRSDKLDGDNNIIAVKSVAIKTSSGWIAEAIQIILNKLILQEDRALSVLSDLSDTATNVTSEQWDSESSSYMSYSDSQSSLSSYSDTSSYTSSSKPSSTTDLLQTAIQEE